MHRVIDNELATIGSWPVVEEVQISEVVLTGQYRHGCHRMRVSRTVLVQASNSRDGSKPHTERGGGKRAMLESCVNDGCQLRIGRSTYKVSECASVTDDLPNIDYQKRRGGNEYGTDGCSVLSREPFLGR